MRIGIDARALSKNLTGIGWYCLAMVKAMKQQGADITLFSPSYLTLPFEIREGLKVVEGYCKSDIACVFWWLTQLPIRLRQHPVDIFWGPAHRIGFFFPRHQIVAVTIHDLVWCRAPDTMRWATQCQERLFVPHSLKRADIILSDSESTTSDVLDYDVRLGPKIKTIPLGCDHPLPLDKQTLPKHLSRLKQPYILFVGTIEPRKNLARLLDAYRMLPMHLRQSFQLVIAGGTGWGQVGIEKRIEDCDLVDRVLLTGYVSTPVLVNLYRHAYCLAMPSLYEGFGLPIVEAQAYGVPILTSNTASMPEVAGEAGVLVNPFDVNSIFHGLKTLLENETLRASLSQKSIKNAKRYSWKKTAQLTLNAFEEAMLSNN